MAVNAGHSLLITRHTHADLSCPVFLAVHACLLLTVSQTPLSLVVASILVSHDTCLFVTKELQKAGACIGPLNAALQ